MSPIRVRGLEKIYRGNRKEPPVHALKPIDLDVEAGEVFGLLGPNGAGKTTLVKLLLGIVHPTSGSGSILERPIGTPSSKEHVGYLPENHRYPQYLSGGAVLRYFGRLSGVDSTTLAARRSELLKLVQMERWETTRVKKYSKGMMQRLGIAQALINDPTVIFLDEPTDGVDPVGRREIRDIIAGLRDQGRTVFLNSHLLSEVEMVCDRVAILNRGELVRMGTVRELTEETSVYRLAVAPEHASILSSLASELGLTIGADGVAMLRATDLADLNARLDRLRSAGALLHSVAPQRQTLEDLFFDTIDGGRAR